MQIFAVVMSGDTVALVLCVINIPFSELEVA